MVLLHRDVARFTKATEELPGADSGECRRGAVPLAKDVEDDLAVELHLVRKPTVIAGMVFQPVARVVLVSEVFQNVVRLPGFDPLSELLSAIS